MLKRDRGVSPVIATVIISGVVVAVGGGVWYYAQGASTIIANDYIDGVMDLLHQVKERFTVEYVYNNSNTLHIWIYNYGEVDIEVDVYVNTTSGSFNSTDINNPIEIESKNIVCANVTVSLIKGEKIAIKAHSRRQNNAFYTCYVSSES